MRRISPIVAAWAFAGLATVAPAQVTNWSDVIFPEHAHDFGTVARGSKVKHSFKLVNSTNQTIHITDWRTKCGCTDVKVGAREIPPGTQTFVEATLDTTKFQGYKASGLTLVFDRPSFAEKDLALTCFIRGDVLLTPGSVDFGEVNRTNAQPQVLTLNYLGGQTNWGVLKLTTLSDHITAKLEELPGTRTPSSVQYRLTASLKPSTPVGYFRDEIVLETNDPQSPKIPVSVTANVQANVVLSPRVLPMGTIRPGQTVSKDVLVRAGRAFTISGVETPVEGLAISQDDSEARPLHKVRVTLTAPAKPGPFHAQVGLKTSLEDEPPAELSVFATVVP
jgi:hypothetical protein